MPAPMCMTHCCKAAAHVMWMLVTMPSGSAVLLSPSVSATCPGMLLSTGASDNMPLVTNVSNHSLHASAMISREATWEWHLTHALTVRCDSEAAAPHMVEVACRNATSNVLMPPN